MQTLANMLYKQWLAVSGYIKKLKQERTASNRAIMNCSPAFVENLIFAIHCYQFIESPDYPIKKTLGKFTTAKIDAALYKGDLCHVFECEDKLTDMVIGFAYGNKQESSYAVGIHFFKREAVDYVNKMGTISFAIISPFFYQFMNKKNFITDDYQVVFKNHFISKQNLQLYLKKMKYFGWADLQFGIEIQDLGISRGVTQCYLQETVEIYENVDVEMT